MSAEVEIRQFELRDLTVAGLAKHIGSEISLGGSDTEFAITTSGSPPVIAHIDIDARTICFAGAYSSFSEAVIDIITRIAAHVKGQVFVEGELWTPNEDHIKNLRNSPWWAWLVLLPFFLVIIVVALPFILVRECYRLFSVLRRRA